MSLFARSALAAKRSSSVTASVPAQNVRYTESSSQGSTAPISESSQNTASQANAGSSMNVRSATTGTASETAVPSGVQAQVLIPGSSTQGSSQGSPQAPSRAPAQTPMPRVDLYVKQDQIKDEDNDETCDDPE
jgi:hypothetical protein